MSSTHRALVFSAIEKYSLMVSALVGTMIVSRLLTPEDIGIYSLGAVVLGIAQVMRDFGVGQYVIQERELTAQKLRAVLAVSFLLAWSMAALIAGLSVPISWFYHEPRLVPLMQLMAVNFLLIPVTSTTLQVLRRNMRFGAICTINMVHGLGTVVFSTVLAWRGFGYMSLAWSSVSATALAMIVGIILRPPELPWLPSRSGMRKVFEYGAYSTAGTLIDEAGVAAPDLVIGKMIGMEGVGLFSKAVGVLSIFNRAITSVVAPVVLPLYAARVRDAGDECEAYLSTVSYITAFSWPFFACLAVLALPVVRILNGDQWDFAAPLVRVLCLSSAIYSVQNMSRYLFVACGHVKDQARLDALTVPVRVLAIVAAAPFGLLVVAWGVVVGTIFRAWLTNRYLFRLNGITFRQLVNAVNKSSLITLATVLGPLAIVNLCAPSARTSALAAAAAVALWVLAVVLVKHPLCDELQKGRRRLAHSFGR